MARNTTGVAATFTATQGTPTQAVGKFTFDATALTAADYVEISVGFKPKYVKFINATDRISVEFFEGMADDTCIKTAATGVLTLETTNKGLTPVATGFRVSQNATLAVCAASKVCYFVAYA